MKEELSCSFCGRKKSETKILIAGIDAHICDQCIEQAHGILVEELSDSELESVAQEMTLRKPQEIKSFLDMINWVNMMRYSLGLLVCQIKFQIISLYGDRYSNLEESLINI